MHVELASSTYVVWYSVEVYASICNQPITVKHTPYVMMT